MSAFPWLRSSILLALLPTWVKLFSCSTFSERSRLARVIHHLRTTPRLSRKVSYFSFCVHPHPLHVSLAFLDSVGFNVPPRPVMFCMKARDLTSADRLLSCSRVVPFPFSFFFFCPPLFLLCRDSVPLTDFFSRFAVVWPPYVSRPRCGFVVFPSPFFHI